MKKIFDEFENYIGAFFQGAMILVLFAQVISRYVFNKAFSWSEELAIIFFVISIYFGATAAIRRNQHLRLEVVVGKLGPKARLVIDIIGNAFFAFFNIVIFTGIMPIIFKLKETGTSTAVTNIPKWMIYSVLPFIFILMIFRLAQDSWEKYKKYKEGNKTNESLS